MEAPSSTSPQTSPPTRPSTPPPEEEGWGTWVYSSAVKSAQTIGNTARTARIIAEAMGSIAASAVQGPLQPDTSNREVTPICPQESPDDPMSRSVMGNQAPQQHLVTDTDNAEVEARKKSDKAAEVEQQANRIRNLVFFAWTAASYGWSWDRVREGLRQIVDWVRPILPESWHIILLDRLTPSPPDSNDPPPNEGWGSYEPEASSDAASILTHIAKKLMGSTPRDEEFFNELGIFLEREGSIALFPLIENLSLGSNPSRSIAAGLGLDLVQNKILARIKDIIDRVNFRDLRVSIADKLARRLEGTAKAIHAYELVRNDEDKEPLEVTRAKHGMEQEIGRYLCIRGDEVEHIRKRVRGILGPEAPVTNIDWAVNCCILDVAPEIVKAVDHLCSEPMVDIYFIQLMQALTKEKRATKQTGGPVEKTTTEKEASVGLDDDELNAWIQVGLAFIAGVCQQDKVAQALNLLKPLYRSEIKEFVQDFCVMDGENLRPNLGIAAAALKKLNDAAVAPAEDLQDENVDAPANDETARNLASAFDRVAPDDNDVAPAVQSLESEFVDDAPDDHETANTSTQNGEPNPADVEFDGLNALLELRILRRLGETVGKHLTPIVPAVRSWSLSRKNAYNAKFLRNLLCTVVDEALYHARFQSPAGE